MSIPLIPTMFWLLQINNLKMKPFSKPFGMQLHFYIFCNILRRYINIGDAVFGVTHRCLRIII